MKLTGIIRKVDNVGRIILPKELRRFFRVFNSDEIEFSIKDNSILIRKLNRFKFLPPCCREYAEAIAEATGFMVIIAECGRIVHVSGLHAKFYEGQSLAPEILAYIENNTCGVFENLSVVKNPLLTPFKNIWINTFVIASQPVGAIIALSNDQDAEATLPVILKTAGIFMAKIAVKGSSRL